MRILFRDGSMDNHGRAISIGIDTPDASLGLNSYLGAHSLVSVSAPMFSAAIATDPVVITASQPATPLLHPR